jgi:hypothetical protein
MNQRDKPKKGISKMSTLSPLNADGYPKNPNSIFIAIQRKYFPHLDGFRSRLGDPNKRIGIPFRQYGNWETLHGRVAKITEFSDGVVIHYPQLLDESPLKWPDAILWVPNQGTVGILNIEPDVQDYLDELNQKHMEDSTSLAYIIEWLFKFRDKLPDGTTEEQVHKMTQFKKIELLERICKRPWSLAFPSDELGHIGQFVQEVDKYGFRTADDFGPAKA